MSLYNKVNFMAIHTHTFGGVSLSGESIDAFEKQFLDTNIPPNFAAQVSLSKGKDILREMQTNGFAVIKKAPIRGAL